MTFVVPKHAPTAAPFEVKLPSRKTPIAIASAEDVLTGETMAQMSAGDFSFFYDLFDEKDRAAVRALHIKTQLVPLVKAWSGDEGKSDS
ncbi:hypothetical protein [Lysinibacter sp. HNR]|uniref:hypothetical protein n=1 Tax=Lysinibacter sp. HNR TaxID=3031408 RepID=UPI00243543F0|nr:hypothetical protein [Lysinibacter sp. HNR]WGD36827.1 hypothetical protein FrondiHNR_10250 [Lysinibacter sp. HNR]